MVSYLAKVREDRYSMLVIITGVSVILLAMVIRLIGLGSESAWIDEAYSINLVHHSIPQIIQGTAADQHPPLYYLLLQFWMIFGHGVVFARLFSSFLGIFNVIQVMLFGWKLGGERLGIGAALLLAISPFHVWYSQEARQYMLLAVLTTAASIELWNCIHGRPRWWLYWIFSALAIYTQYFAIFVLLAHGVIVFWWAYHNRHKQIITAWLISILGVGIVFIPWLPTAINQFKYHTMPWITEPTAGDVINVFLVLLFGNGIQVLPLIIRWLGIIGLLVIEIWCVYRLIKYGQDNQKSFSFVILWALVPIAVISIVSNFFPIFQLKQYLIVLPALILLVSFTVMNLPRSWGMLLFIGFVIVPGFILIYQQTANTKDDWRAVANYLNNNIQIGDVVYANPAASSLALELYWKSPHPFEGYPINYNILTGGWKGVPLTSEIINNQLSTLSNKYKRVWLVEFFPQFWDSKGEIANWLSGHGNQLNDISFSKIRLRLYQLNPQ